MKVVLFCGGQGMRMRDYSDAIPKPMVPIGYRPILWHLMKYYAHFYGRDSHGHLAYKDHPWYASCWRFCERYDQAAFDPATPTQPLSHFEPMLREVFSRKPFDPAILKQPAKA